jgi:hypothetical protein
MWHWFGTPEEFARKSLVLDAWCEKVGRDPGTIEHLVGLSDEYSGAFDPELGKEFLAAGAHQLTFKVTEPDYDFRFVKEWVSWRDETNSALTGIG